MDVAFSDDTEVPDDIDGCCSEHVVVGVREGLGRRNNDGISSVDTEGIKVLLSARDVLEEPLPDKSKGKKRKVGALEGTDGGKEVNFIEVPGADGKMRRVERAEKTSASATDKARLAEQADKASRKAALQKEKAAVKERMNGETGKQEDSEAPLHGLQHVLMRKASASVDRQDDQGCVERMQRKLRIQADKMRKDRADQGIQESEPQELEITRVRRFLGGVEAVAH